MNETDANPPVAYWTPARLLVALILVAGILGPVGVLTYLALLGPEVQAVAGDPALPPRLRLAPIDQFNTDDLRVRLDQLVPGGPRKDGIPSITDPNVAAMSQADFLDPQDRVIVATVNGESRAYPIKLLNFHECVNDTLGGVPIAVIYCPLCDSVSVVDRRLDDQDFEFGISGLLTNSNVLLYDRTDQALWSQIGLRAISGPNAGRSLKHLDNWQFTTFGDWRQKRPDGDIADFNTGHLRNYRRDVYADMGYFRSDNLMIPVEPTSDRFPNKEPVIGVQHDRIARAYPVAAVRAADSGVLRDTLDGDPIEIHADKAGTIKIVEAPEEARVVHTFWFAWYAFWPETEVWGAEE